LSVVWITHGRAQGMAYQNGVFVRGDGTSSDDETDGQSVLYRKALDEEGNPTGTWEACGSMTPEVTGRWMAPPQKEAGYVYGVKSSTGATEPDSTSLFVTREYADLSAWFPSGYVGRPAVCIEPVTGICHLAYVSGEDVRYTQSDPWIATGFRGWRYGNLAPIKGTPQTIAVFEGGYTDPSVVVMPGRTVIVSARSTTAPYPVTLKRSLNQGRTWEDVPVGTFVADLTQLSLTQHRGVLHGAGIVGSNAVYRYSDDGGTTAKSLDRTATVTAIICAAEDEQPDIVRDPTGILYVPCKTSTGIVIMTSSDGGNTWADTDSVA